MSLRAEIREGLFLFGVYLTLSGSFPDRLQTLRPE